MRGSRGFSLVEVIVSLFILGILLLLFQAVIRSASLVKAAGDQEIATAIARNELEGLRAAGYAALPASGSFADNLLSTLPDATTTLSVSSYTPQTKLVTVAVLWQDPASSASSTVTLSTLITKVGGLP